MNWTNLARKLAQWLRQGKVDLSAHSSSRLVSSVLGFLLSHIDALRGFTVIISVRAVIKTISSVHPDSDSWVAAIRGLRQRGS